jgi:hypothetical protein
MQAFRQDEYLSDSATLFVSRSNAVARLLQPLTFLLARQIGGSESPINELRIVMILPEGAGYAEPTEHYRKKAVE